MTASDHLFVILLCWRGVQVVPPHVPPPLVEATVLVLLLVVVLMVLWVLLLFAPLLRLLPSASPTSATPATSSSPAEPMVVALAPSASLVEVTPVVIPMSVSSSPIVHIFRVFLFSIYELESIVINELLSRFEVLSGLFSLILLIFTFAFTFFAFASLLAFFILLWVSKLFFLLLLFGLFIVDLFFFLIAEVGRLHSLSLLLLLVGLFLINLRLWSLYNSTSEYLPLSAGVLFHEGSDELVQVSEGLVAAVADLGLALLDEAAEVLDELFPRCLPYETLRLPGIQVVKTAVQEIQRV